VPLIDTFFPIQSNLSETGFLTSRFLESPPIRSFGLARGILLDRAGASRINQPALPAYEIPPDAESATCNDNAILTDASARRA
jgi:hypothetical protein